MKYIAVFVLIPLIIGISCSREAKNDHSLTIDEYRKMGIPEITKRWDAEDYSTAMRVLSEIKWSRPFELPAKDSQKSGALFNHLLNPENMPSLYSDPIALHEKALQYLDILKGYEDLSNLYTDPRLKKQYYHRELMEISLRELKIGQDMLDHGEKLRNSVDPVDQSMLEGFPTIQENFVSLLQNTIALQSNSSQFLATDIAAASDSIYLSILRNKDWMDSNAIENLKNAINVAIDSAATEAIKSKYTELSGLLK